MKYKIFEDDTNDTTSEFIKKVNRFINRKNINVYSVQMHEYYFKLFIVVEYCYINDEKKAYKINDYCAIGAYSRKIKKEYEINEQRLEKKIVKLQKQINDLIDDNSKLKTII
jgi:hypothetical protein